MSDEKFLDYQKPQLIDMTSTVARGLCDYGTIGDTSCVATGGGASPDLGDCGGGESPLQPATCSGHGAFVVGTCISVGIGYTP